MSRFISLALRILAVLLVLRALLIFAGANADQPLVSALILFTQPLAGAFAGIFPQPSDEAGIIPLDVGALLAALALELLVRVLGVVARRADAIA